MVVLGVGVSRGGLSGAAKYVALYQLKILGTIEEKNSFQKVKSTCDHVTALQVLAGPAAQISAG